MKRLLFAAFAAVVATVVQAKTCVWTGGGQKTAEGLLQLFDSANWEGNVTPEDGDTLQITTADKISVNKSGYTFENVVYTNTSTTAITELTHGDFTVTGRETKFVLTGMNIYFGSFLTVAEGAKVEFCQRNSSAFSLRVGAISGKGEVDITGTTKSGGTAATFNLGGNADFHGTWNISRPLWVGVGDDPFGADDATANIYGTDGVANHVGKVSFQGGTVVLDAIHVFGKATISTSTGGLTTFNGNFTYTAYSGYNQLDVSCGIANKNSRSGFIFKKDCVCAAGNNAWMNIYSYSPGTYHFEVRGKFTPTVSGSNPPVFGSFHDDLVYEVYLGGKMASGHVWGFIPRSKDHFHMMGANVLPYGTMRIDWGSYCLGTPDTYLDLHGYDQKISTFQYDNTKRQAFTVKSTDRPATLKVGNNEGVSHVVPLLSGKVSLYGFDLGWGSNAGHSFTNTCDTTGWIGSEKNGLAFADTAQFPNLGGIECTGAATVSIKAGATFNSNMSLDVHDVTGYGVRVATGKNLDVKHVFAESVDVPAGVYCRTGAGVQGATEVSWLTTTQWDADGAKGTVTVAAHDPVWIWTGKGSTTSFTDAANWGAGTSPDLTNKKLTLNLKNAAGKTGMVVPLDGTIAPAGAFNCGDYSKGAVTFGGSGTLALGGAANETNDLKMVFTDSSSFTWNGPGTLYLTGNSTSTGTLTVNGGKVIMDYASWAGKVVVAAGADLVVNNSCGNAAFADGARVAVNGKNGKLTIGDKTATYDPLALAVKALYIDGDLARHGKTYGSAASAAVKKDDAHFGGMGTIVSAQKRGLMVYVR